MPATDDIQKLVADLVARVSAAAATPDAELTHPMVVALEHEPGFTRVEGLTFRRREHEVKVGRADGMRHEIAALETVRGLGLAIAPELVATIPLGPRGAVLVTRYAACAGEELVPAGKTKGPFRQAAVDRLRKDVRALLDRGLVHPSTRGGTHWLVSSESETLVLEKWAALRELEEPEEGQEMLAAVEAFLERRGVRAPAAPEGPTLGELAQVADYLRDNGEPVTAIEGGLVIPAQVTLKEKTGVQILWGGERVLLRTPLGIEPPAEKARALIAELNRDLESGAFVPGPPLAFEVRLDRDGGGGVDILALEMAIHASREAVLTYQPRFAQLLPKPAPPPPAAVTIGSRQVTLTAAEVARVKAAVEAEWRPFLHRMDGPLSCYERLQPWWKGHRVVEVQSPLPMPAVGIGVAIRGSDGAVSVLRGHPEHIVAMAAADPPPPLVDPDQARAYAFFCESMSTDAQWGELPVASFDEIPFRQLLTAEEKAQLQQLRMRHAADMHAPKLEKTAAGFVLTLWTVSMSRLVYRELLVPPDGRIQRKNVIVADPIPVPPGKAWAAVGNRYVPVA